MKATDCRCLCMLIVDRAYFPGLSPNILEPGLAFYFMHRREWGIRELKRKVAQICFCLKVTEESQYGTVAVATICEPRQLL
jgi:hypothetical protein